MPTDFTRGWVVRWRRLQFPYDYAVEFYWMFMGLREKEKEEKFQFSPKQETILDITLISSMSLLSLVVSQPRPAAMLLGAASPFFLFLDVSLISQVASTF